MDEETKKALLRYLYDQYNNGYFDGDDVLQSMYQQIQAGKQYFTADEIIKLTLGEDYYSD